MLAVRAIIFRVFFWAGLSKINDWDATQYMFESEFPLPLIPAYPASIMATGFELVCSVLILLGLATRTAAMPLLGMALTIQFVLGTANPAYDKLEHYLWIGLLLVLVGRGGGLWSFDRLLVNLFPK